MGYVYYDTERKKFEVECLADYTGKNPDFVMEKYSKLGVRFFPDDTVTRWVRARLLPPNRQGIGDILKSNGMKEYDEMRFFEITHGYCAKDPYYFEEIQRV